MAYLINEFQTLDLEWAKWEQDLLKLYIDALFQPEVTQIPENYAKTKHRWKNRTGQAETKLKCFVTDGSGLEGMPVLMDGGYLAIAYDPVDERNNRHYALDLELGHGGKYAILQETLEVTGEDIFKAIGNYVFVKGKQEGLL